MAIIKFALQLGALGSGRISSIRLEDEIEIEIDMQLFCEWCGIPTKTFTIGSADFHKFQCEECHRIGTMDLVHMTEDFALPCNGKRQEMAIMICSQLVPNDKFLKIKGVFIVTDADGGEHAMEFSGQKRWLDDMQGKGRVLVKIVHDFVRINK